MNKFKIEIKWGVIFILMSLTWILIERVCGLHSTHIDLHPYISMLFMVPAVAVFVLAIKDKKQNYYSGTITYKQGFVSGLIVTLIVTLFSPITQWIISNIISPDYFKNAINYSVSTGKLSLQAASEYFNFSNYVVQSLIMSAVAGVVTSAIVAYFYRTKRA